ncbi:MAG: DNA-directed RNA polymerase subunit alpha [Candidatus Kerfeldbacteria bacterium]|nr:DNA-directed RNA polymerase subunit alpha [Candidatus Kerfeldbacteria bacterium]
MELLPLPQHLTSAKVSANRARIVVEPCYPGYGTTLGNALRRVLLSSLEGAAVTAVKINGVDHEFSTIPGVKEDVVDLLLNIKQLRLKVHSAEPIKFQLKVTGEKEVTAADITTHSEVEVMNPELHLATLTDKKASLEIEFTAQQGRGYVTVESRDKEKLDIGTIAVDAIYTPVRRVGYGVENVRVGQMTNYDKLTLDVETDGSLSPLEAVKEAARILIDHFSVIVGQAPAESAVLGEAVSEELVVTEAAEEPKVGKKRGRPKKEV